MHTKHTLILMASHNPSDCGLGKSYYTSDFTKNLLPHFFDSGGSICYLYVKTFHVQFLVLVVKPVKFVLPIYVEATMFEIVLDISGV